MAFSLKAESESSFSDLIDKDVKILYQLNENKLFWEENEKVENFFTLLRASYLNGLNPDDYNVNLKSDKKLIVKIYIKVLEVENKPINIISGYKSPKTNNTFRRKSDRY